jgi:hypothetical protein
LTFDEDVLEFLLGRTPTRMHEVVARFRNSSNTAQRLLQAGVFTAAELEAQLRELARRGAITGVWDELGDDLIAAARRERDEQLGSRLPQPTVAAGDVSSLFAPPSESQSFEPPAVAASFSAYAPVEVRPSAELEPWSSTSSTVAQPEPESLSSPPVVSAIASEPGQEPVAAVSDSAVAPRDSRPGPAAVSREAAALEPEAVVAEVMAPETVASEVAAAEVVAGEVPVSELPTRPVSEDASATALEDALLGGGAAEAAQPAAASAAASGEAFDMRKIVLPVPVPARVRRHSGRHGVQLVLAMAAVVALASASLLAFDADAELRTEVARVLATWGFLPSPRMAAPETTVRSGIDPGLALGVVLPYIDAARGVSVGHEQGLLVIEYNGEEPRPNVELDGRILGAPPLAVALGASQHELLVRQEREVASAHPVIVQAGTTRVITLPLPPR